MIRFHPEAIEELTTSMLYYNTQKPGLGLKLLDAIDKAVAVIQAHPNAWSPSPLGKFHFRKYLLPEFPFGLVYKIVEKDVRIMAVMHLSRKPGYWKKRPENRDKRKNT